MLINSMMNEYALLAMIYLAMNENPKNSRKILAVEEIAKNTGIPLNFLSKIMNDLSKAKLVCSSRGRRGGYFLAKSSSQITALNIMEAMKGQVKLNHCLEYEGSCSVSNACPFYSMWIEAQNCLENIFNKYTLHSLAVCLSGDSQKKDFLFSLKTKFSQV
ncbi:MAG: hypothetical protein A3I11_07025 [Elusimicrobia bacterium RIFCSPLOWO2_02_FULL_39_32]|nr:MAG: hypothetical protein A3B80_05600 [Elusimicrobia bacterium RIFCSPHIGHO2_02_FULL_39_36]OGR91940.1 MAG: hypothetical protein A3I11_07025 [Elusimicrobia bacterium RIFCSPLOWO2_02_FULL_39_32]OGR98767.1 MAG: hypothetical protein A3G85_05405 [Elusimicrobia bacterium RIFCSPLOWO2_12_FULL_39_28]